MLDVLANYQNWDGHQHRSTFEKSAYILADLQRSGRTLHQLQTIKVKTQKIVMSRRSLEMLVVQRLTTFWLWNLIILDPTRTYQDSIEICWNWSGMHHLQAKNNYHFQYDLSFHSQVGCQLWWRLCFGDEGHSPAFLCIAPGPSSFLSETSSGLPTLSSNSKITVNH